MADEQKRNNISSSWMITGVVAVISVILCSVAWIKVGESRAALAKARQDAQVALEAQRKSVIADMEQKYQADRISYDVMARQIAVLQEKLKAAEAQAK